MASETGPDNPRHRSQQPYWCTSTAVQMVLLVPRTSMVTNRTPQGCLDPQPRTTNSCRSHRSMAGDRNRCIQSQCCLLRVCLVGLVGCHTLWYRTQPTCTAVRHACGRSQRCGPAVAIDSGQHATSGAAAVSSQQHREALCEAIVARRGCRGSSVNAK